jgi:diguanylate cyclase (GGDEF)-like protein
VAEDEDTLRTVIQEVLEEDGHLVTGVPSGEAALAEFRRSPFPIVITDIVMGHMSGLQLLSEIKTIEPEAIVLIMTSHASLETATGALRSGAYDFIIKPFEDLEVISSVVRRAAEKADLIHRNRRLNEDLKDKARELNEANTALLKLADSLKEYANKDGLTGLYTHRLFREALVREIAKVDRNGGDVSVIFMDVDHFKTFNDTHGHLAGDEALRTLARLAEQQVRAPGLVARYGGEEIVALVPSTSKEDARALAERIRRSVESHAFEDQDSRPLGRVTLSLGVATYPGDGSDATTLIDSADHAVYEAKSAGRNTVRG